MTTVITTVLTNVVTAYLAVAVTIGLTVASQILQKRVADKRGQLAARNHSVRFYGSQPLFWQALLCLGAAMGFWLYALMYIDVSKAYALLSVNYLLVPLASHYAFNDRLSKRQWLGAAVICCGLALVGHS